MTLRPVAAGAHAATLLLALQSAPATAAHPLPTTLIVPPDQHTLGIHRVNDLHLKLFTGPRSRFQDPQGIACVKLVAQDDPARAADDDELTVYGVNSGEPSIIYNDSMTSARIWRHPMREPHGIAADVHGRVVVADTGNDRLLLLGNREGRLALERVVGRRGAAPGEFDRPFGVALDSRGRIWVADTGNDRVQLLDPGGRPIAAFGGPGPGDGSLASPTAIAVVDRDEPWSFRKRDLVFVVDRGGRRIQSFTADGAFVRAFEDSAASGRRFAYVALDYYNNLYATDPRRSQIHKFDETLRPITSFGEPGAGDAQFLAPTGIAIWRRFGQVFLAESAGAQYYWVGTDIVNPRAVPETLPGGGTGIVSYSLTEHSEVDVELLDRKGKLLRAIARGLWQPPGAHRVPWLAALPAGTPLPEGTYQIRVRARATYSSKKHFARETLCAVRVGPAPQTSRGSPTIRLDGGSPVR